MNHAFIGFGNMAKAVYKGLKDDDNNEFAYMSKTNKHKEIRATDDLQKLVKFADIIWLGIKPNNLREVLEQLEKHNLRDKLIVSLVAGKSIDYIENRLDQKVAIVRLMPNLAIAYQKSVTAFKANKVKSSNMKSLQKSLMKLGSIVEIPEDKFDEFTAIFGSGPAFLLEILKVFKNKTGGLKIPDNAIDKLLYELVMGTMTFFNQNHDKSIDDLVERITSEGGVTQAGLEYYKDNQIEKLLGNVIISAKKRSEEMSD